MSIAEFKHPREVLDHLWIKYLHAIDAGEVTPWLYPQSTLGIALVFLYLLAPRGTFLDSNLFKYSSWGLMTYYHIWMIANTRSASVSTGFGIGIVLSFYVLLSSAFIIFNDAKANYKRVESRTSLASIEGKPAIQSPPQSGPQNTEDTAGSTATHAQPGTPAAQNPPDKREPEYFWQPFPSTSSFRVRLDWVVDLISSFRGIGWSFQTSYVPPIPPAIQSDLRPSTDKTPLKDMNPSPSGIHRIDDPVTLLKSSFYTLLKGAIAIDALKTIMMHDPYFWGSISSPPPPWLPSLIRNSWFLTRSYRSVVSLTAIWLVLRTLFATAPLFFVFLLGQKTLGVRGEAWLYPAHWGNFSCVLERGVAGYWGGWWHQTFRYSFTSLSSFVLRTLHINSKSAAGKVIGIFTVFFASGVLHSSGSIAQIADTKPWHPMLFFMLQPFALLGEDVVRGWLHRTGIADRTPPWAGKAANLAWTTVWLFCTGPLLIDDFARGGVWLWEPPGLISIFRGGLGLGAEGDGWINWRYEWGRTIRWHSDPKGRWWMCGLVL